MKPRDLLINAVEPALAMLDTFGVKSDARARVLMMAIAGQESEWLHRRQIGGPARSYWQFEQGGGVLGVLTHITSRDRIRKVCDALDIPCTTAVVYEAMAWNDVLAACMARLLLYTDPHALPGVGDEAGGWKYYIDNWRPGKPHPQTWPARFETARQTVGLADSRQAEMKV